MGVFFEFDDVDAFTVGTEGRPGDLASAERERLYARGLVLSLPKGPQILAASPNPH